MSVETSRLAVVESVGNVTSSPRPSGWTTRPNSPCSAGGSEPSGRRDHVVEGMGRGYVALDAAARRQQHRIRLESHPLCEGDEQGRFVLAVAVAGLQHGGGEPRLEPADPERERDVAEILRHPAVHQAQRILQRPGGADEAGERRVERGSRHVAVARELAVPSGHVRPGSRLGDRDDLIDGVRVRGERLALHLGYLARRPDVNAPAADLGRTTPEGDIRLLDSHVERGGSVDDVARATGESPGGDAPAVLEVAGHDRLERLDRIAVVEQRARCDPSDRDAAHPHVGIDGGLLGHGGDALLLVRWLGADHLSAGPHHAHPVERQPLPPADV